jgi:hypothetical protein
MANNQKRSNLLKNSMISYYNKEPFYYLKINFVQNDYE